MNTSRPSYGDGSEVCVYFLYVYIVCDLLVSLECLCNSFCSPWDDFGIRFGTLWGALGSQGGVLGVALASLWMPMGPFGAPWAPKWSVE